jgi:hypothetical protein
MRSSTRKLGKTWTLSGELDCGKKYAANKKGMADGSAQWSGASQESKSKFMMFAQKT